MAKKGKRIKFENSFTKQLYIEVSGICNMKPINRSYISQEYMWQVWQDAYKSNFGCTKYILRDL